MIIVTGEGRCGTSLVMQTLKILGIIVPAPLFLDEHKGIEHYNKNGFLELNIEGGIKDERYKGMAVKMFPLALKNTPPELISKVIRMKRNREDACISMIPVLAALHDTELTTFEIYDTNCAFLDKYLENCNHLIINFEEFLESPLAVIEQIIEYLDINPSLSQVKDAYNNVDLVTKLKS